MAGKIKVLMIYTKKSSFVKRDIDILREEYDVTELHYRGKEDLFKLSKLVTKTDVNISWFILGYATSAAFLSRLLGKKSILIAGGWDVVSMPEIGYGAMLNTNRIKRTSRALREADRVIAVSESMMGWVSKWVKRDDISILYHGFDSEKYSPGGEKENIALTVGDFRNDVTVIIKGLDIFIKTAALLPEVKFIVIGEHEPDTLKMWSKKASSNVEILDFQPEDKLIDYYRRAKVYAQLSYQESFGCALAEAMLCGCVPVASRRGALPEVMGQSGFLVKYGDVKSTKEYIEKALASDKGGEARIRIMSDFPIEKRREGLIKIIEGSLEKK
jgi:glycosyltransferase involved in cell wall biosynthesis